MKKFDFKLKGLLKIREAREKVVKTQLGEILRQINILKEEIIGFRKAIDEAYKSQEKMMENAVDAQFLNYFPYYIKGQNDHIKLNENKIYSLQRRYDEKLKELQSAKADVHVIESLKEKAEVKYKKEVEKQLQDILDESSLRKEYMRRAKKEGI